MVNREELETKRSFEPVSFTFHVIVKLQPHGPETTFEPVMPSDLIDINSETWLESYLRKSRPNIRFDTLTLRLLPVLAEGSDSRCAGLIVESSEPDGRTAYRRFSIQALAPVAVRAAQKLVKDGVLEAGQPYHYEVIAKRRLDAAFETVSANQAPVGKTIVKHMPLIYRDVHFPSLLQKAEAFGSVDGSMPVFYEKSTFMKAEHLARVGAAYHPPMESGAVILGSLCSCPSKGEFFVVATDAIELADTQQSSFSLTYTSKTWTNIQAELKARQAHAATRGERIVGQCHGHNFLPKMGENRCESCTKRNTCGLTSVFISESDLLWSRCVFSRQPWAFCHIFGSDVGGKPVHGLFGFREGRLVERGFYIIDDLPAALCETNRSDVAQSVAIKLGE